MSEGGDHRDVQQMYQDMISSFDHSDEDFFRKAAYLCLTGCISNNLNEKDKEMVCVGRCLGSLPFLHHIVQQEVTNLQNEMHQCGLDCSDKMARAIPAGAKEGDPAVQRASFQNMDCIVACSSRAVSLVSRMHERFEAAADIAARRK